MAPSRDRKWLSVSGLIGGLAMFAAEALIVGGLAAAAWILSLLILSAL